MYKSGRFALMLPAFLMLSATAVAHAADRPKAVVELFTSQGCSSCPAADALLGRYAASGDVLALSFHVDYWNYLGWKDTFSKAEFTERQQRYAASFGKGNVYTPQAVVNGRDHAVGSRENALQAMIDQQAKSGLAPSVGLNTTHDGNLLRVTTDSPAGEATLYIVYFDRKKKVAIQRGENRGKTITYHNVVREVAMAGMMKDGKLDVTLPLDDMKRKGTDACALILQEKTPAGTPGPIVGATVVENF